MPPQRTIPPAKAVKTERTHEENQERAYIAASRRSDRSLEARVESARRASEIHKRRTGRSLRVTEQDVVNEEMYEEEDDDLPMQYRRLTAHLQTGSADFNRRLAAYLTNHVAMRSALDQAITNSYAQQYPNAPQFAHNHSMFPSPMLPGQQMLPPRSPSLYRASQPYPSPNTQGFSTNPHSRAVSIATTQDVRALTGHSNAGTPLVSPTLQHGNRRMSMPATTATPPASSPHPLSDVSQRLALSDATALKLEDEQEQSHPQQQQQPQRLDTQNTASPFDMNAFQNFSPFATALPPESQMLLGGGLDPNDPFTSMLMAGSENMPMYPYSNMIAEASMQKHQELHPSYDGLSATLSPLALDLNQQKFSQSSSAIDSTPPSFAMYDQGSDFKPPSLNKQNSSNTSAFEGDWNAFIDTDSWEQSGS